MELVSKTKLEILMLQLVLICKLMEIAQTLRASQIQKDTLLSGHSHGIESESILQFCRMLHVNSLVGAF
jgi:hypothetical protein